MPTSAKKDAIKDTMLTLRITADIKRMAVERAAAERRSITAHVEFLLVRDYEDNPPRKRR